METTSDIERNRRIIAVSQFVSSFFNGDDAPEEAEVARKEPLVYVDDGADASHDN